MAENKSSISKKSSYLEIGEYWDTHELPEDSEEVAFTVELVRTCIISPSKTR